MSRRRDEGLTLPRECVNRHKHFSIDQAREKGKRGLSRGKVKTPLVLFRFVTSYKIYDFTKGGKCDHPNAEILRYAQNNNCAGFPIRSGMTGKISLSPSLRKGRKGKGRAILSGGDSHVVV
jgi:hypothetical protein